MDSILKHIVSDSPIAALATAPGPAGVCVVRIAGDGALAAADRLVPSSTLKPSQRRGGTFFHAAVAHPLTGEPLDDVVMLIYRAPYSYTGEDTVELQGHGGSVPSRRLLEAALAAGARLAEPGEFTKRAFLNGRMDLTQAEAICDFIQSKTDRAAHVARAQLDGVLGRQVGRLYEGVTELCAGVEHLLDFDEGELPESFLQQNRNRLSALSGELERLAATWNEGHLLRDGALVVISGRPNSGKSSLMNALLGRERAIVHATPGTTRDVIEEGYALSGVPLRLVDTAGLRETGDAIEQEGIARARELIRRADLNIHLIDRSVPLDERVAREVAALSTQRVILGLTKSDLPACSDFQIPTDVPQVRLSLKTGEGLDALKEAMSHALGLDAESYGQPVISLRHAAELRQSLGQLGIAASALEQGPAHLVIAAGHLREAAEALGRIVGRVYSDDLLDAIFSRFCVGK